MQQKAWFRKTLYFKNNATIRSFSWRIRSYLDDVRVILMKPYEGYINYNQCMLPKWPIFLHLCFKIWRTMLVVWAFSLKYEIINVFSNTWNFLLFFPQFLPPVHIFSLQLVVWYWQILFYIKFFLWNKVK
jgi:hypothetical protein